MNVRVYSLAGWASFLLFWMAYFTLSGLRAEYSIFTKAVSELGSVGAPRAWVWNLLGYVIPGLLIVLFSWGLRSYFLNDPGGKLASGSLAVSGLMMTLSGIFPGDFDDRQSLTMLLHTVGSFGSYLAFLLAAFTFPSVMRKRTSWRAAVLPLTICTWVTIVFGSWPFLFPTMPAVGQRVIFLFYFIWISIAAFYLAKADSTKGR